MNDEIRTFARIGHFHSDTLLEISIDSFLKFELLQKEYEFFKNKGNFKDNGAIIYSEQEKIDELGNSLLKESIKTIIFLGAFLEAYFFDLSAITLGQRYTENHIEKIDLTSKIILVPRLITGKEIDKSLHFWAEIKALIKWRNKIVHNKTKDWIEFSKNINPDNYDPKPLFEEYNLSKFINSTIKLFEELDRIDPKGYHSMRINFNIKRLNKKNKNATRHRL